MKKSIVTFGLAGLLLFPACQKKERPRVPKREEPTVYQKTPLKKTEYFNGFEIGREWPYAFFRRNILERTDRLALKDNYFRALLYIDEEMNGTVDQIKGVGVFGDVTYDRPRHGNVPLLFEEADKTLDEIKKEYEIK